MSGRIERPRTRLSRRICSDAPVRHSSQVAHTQLRMLQGRNRSKDRAHLGTPFRPPQPSESKPRISALLAQSTRPSRTSPLLERTVPLDGEQTAILAGFTAFPRISTVREAVAPWTIFTKFATQAGSDVLQEDDGRKRNV